MSQEEQDVVREFTMLQMSVQNLGQRLQVILNRLHTLEAPKLPDAKKQEQPSAKK